MNDPFETLEKQGTLIRADGKNPLLLKGKEKIWIIKSGEVNVFSIKHKKGEFTGHRNFLFCGHPGEALFGLDYPDEDEGTVLIGVGKISTELVECSKDLLIQLAQNPAITQTVANLMCLWVDGLSCGIRKDTIAPKDCKELGKETFVEKPTPYWPPSHQTVWIKQETGASFFMGNKDWFSLPINVFFPVAPHAWIQVEEKSTFSVASTQSLLQSKDAWSSLDTFHSLILNSIIANVEHTEHLEVERLINRHRIDRMALGNALLEMGSIFIKEEETLQLGHKHENPLIASCALVAKAMGMKITPLDKSFHEKITLAKIARNSRFRTRKILLRGQWWNEDSGPLLGFLEKTKQPVALIPDPKKSYKLYNSVDESVTEITPDRVSLLSPIAFTFYRPFPEKEITLKDFLKFGVRGCGKDILRIALMGLFGSLLALLLPLLMGIVFQTIIPEAQLGQLSQIVFILTMSAIAMLFFQITRGMAILRVENKMEVTLQAALWDRLISLPTPFFRKYTAGDLTKRGLSVLGIRERLTDFIVNAIITFIFSIFYFLLLFYYEVKLALWVGGISFLAIVGFAFLFKKTAKYYLSIYNLEGKNTGLILQFITGISKLRIFGAEDRAFHLWSKDFVQKKKFAFSSGTLQNIVAAFNSGFPVLALMAIFGWIVVKYTGDFPVGEFVGFVSAFTFFQTALLQLMISLLMSVDTIPLFQRTEPILQALTESDATKASPGELSGDIEVDGVYFRYTEEGPFILKDLSLSAKPGEFIALVGASGSGKSTLLRQLLGFETPSAGTIYYDQQDMRTLDPREVRQQIGVVLQTSKLMPGDILKNIIGASNLTIDDAWEAARMVGIDEDIKAMPMGMFTLVGPEGGGFSGGQRQRLLIARAIVKKPRILFFDEATSALDNKTQAIVADSISKLKTTRIVIAHRLSTVIHADRIYVVTKGEIVQTGTYDELMQQKGLFVELAKRQLS